MNDSFSSYVVLIVKFRHIAIKFRTVVQELSLHEQADRQNICKIVELKLCFHTMYKHNCAWSFMTDVSCLTFIFSGNQLGPPWSHTISPSVNAQLLYLPMLRTNDEVCSLCQVVHWFLIPVSVLCRRFLFDDWIMTDREPRDRNMLRLPTVDLRSRW